MRPKKTRHIKIHITIKDKLVMQFIVSNICKMIIMIGILIKHISIADDNAKTDSGC